MRFEDWRPDRIEQGEADIRSAVQRVKTYVSGASLDDFRRDEIRQDAVARQFLIIAEAVDRIFELERTFDVPVEHRLEGRRPAIPWREIRAMGVLIRHAYGREDPRELWWAATGGDLDRLEVATRRE